MAAGCQLTLAARAIFESATKAKLKIPVLASH